MIPLTISKILEYLQKKQIPVERQKETDQISLVLKGGEREFPLFIRIFDGELLLQLLAFIPCNTKIETRVEMARLLHVLNKELDLPGFGMDESSDTLFYRLMLPVKDKKIDPLIFDAMLNAILAACTTFTPVIAAVAFGSVTCNEVVKHAKEQMEVLEKETNR